MKLLFVASRYPWPPRRGDQLRAVQAVDALGKVHDVTLLVPEPPPGAAAPAPSRTSIRLVTYRRRAARAPVGVARALLGGLPLQCGLFHSPDLGRKIRRLAPEADLAIFQLVRLALHLEDFGATPVVVDLIDSLSLNFRRRASLDHPLLRPLLAHEAGRLEAAEARLVAASRACAVVCERDRAELAGRLGPAASSRLAVVPLAVTPPPARTDAGEEAEEAGAPVLALTGNLGYFVNRDAVEWWLAEVWPRLSRERPEVRLVVAGARPPRSLARAVSRAGAELLASPPDLAAVLARATIALAPMRGGSGVPVKILEAWAQGVPVVASPWAAAGTAGRPGEDFWLAETPDEWVRRISELLEDPLARRRLAAAGRRRLADDSPERVGRRWLELVETAG